MKKFTLTFVTILFLITGILAQTPNQFKYQAVLRNADGTIMADESVTVDISILQGSTTGANIFSERHSITTTAQGLINLNIGSVEDLSGVDWSTNTYFIEISVNSTVLGTSQLLSVPYAINAKIAENVFSGDYNDLTNQPTLFDGVWNNLTGTPTTIAGYEITDAFSGNYDDLTNQPTLFDGAWSNLIGTPTTISGYGITDAFDGTWSSLSGTAPNISTFSNNVGYLTNETDGDVTNEIQTFSEVLTESADAGNIAINNMKVGDCITCDINNEGSMRYNSVTKNMEFCDGTEWIPLNVGTPCSPQPTTANAGIDQPDATGTTTTLTANAPTEGTGKWTISSGTGGSFINNTLATTEFTGIAGQAYSLTWTISNTCYENSDNVTVSFEAPPPVTDIDGNVYDVITIGSQIWMAENLKVTHFPNGDAISHVTDNTAWGNLSDNDTDDAYCFYNNDNTTGAGMYGALYTYAAATNGNSSGADVQGVCPTGWHLPSNAEWTELIDFLGGGSIAGGKMKETGTLHWNNPNTGATNESRFSAHPSGYRHYTDGSFHSYRTDGYWWSSTQSGTNAWYCTLGYDDTQAYRWYLSKSAGFSVRCLKN